MAHTCNALVVTCIDFRFQKNIEAWLQEHVGTGEYDRVAWAGGVFDSYGILKQVDISVRLHHIKRLILMNHEDCGAYGSAGTPQKHKEDLKTIAKRIKTLHPKLTIELYFARLNGEFERVK